MKTKKLNLLQFKEYISQRKCYCFGCGLQGTRILNMMENWGYRETIVAFTDNNRKRVGGRISNGVLSYPIVSVSEFVNAVSPEDVIIICCADVVNIFEQLDQYDNLSNVVCFNLGELGLQQLIVSDYEKVVRESEEPIIPKIIHYFWGGNPMPDLMKRNIERWHELCPDYEIRQWNEHNYDVSKNRYMQQAYEADKWGFVPDYARLDIVYQYGGIYLDTDVSMVRRPDELLYQRCFAIKDASFFLNAGASFGAMAGMGIIRELRDYYDTAEFIFDDGSINRQPAQYHAYQVMRKYGYRVNDRFQQIEGMNIYPMIMAGTNAYTMQMRITEHTFFLHYGTATWLDKKYKQEKNRLYENNKNCVGVVGYGL